MNKNNFTLSLVTLRGVFRRYWATSIMLLIVLAGSFGAFLLSSLTQTQVHAMNEYITGYKIRCTVVNPSGESTDYRQLSDWDAKRLLEDPEYTDRICDVELMYTKRLQFPEDYVVRYIYSLTSDPALTEADVTVKLYPGFSEEAFKTNQQVCLIPIEEAHLWPEGVIPVEGRYGEAAELTIIGTVEGGYDRTYYVPFFMEWDYEEDLTVMFFVEHCSFAIKDNTKLDEIKSFLWSGDLFQEPAQGNHPDGPLGLLIQDELYLQTLAEMEDGLQLLNILQPVLLVLVGCVGLLTGHLTTRSRIKEFAVMRCLGMRKGKIFRLAILEQVIVSLVGLGLGLVLGLAVSGGEGLVLQAVLNAVTVALIFLVGTGLAATRIAGINVMKLMKVED